jgi:hypothetical protein
MNRDCMTDETLKGLLQVRQLPRKAKLLGILAVENGRPKGQRQIRATAKQLGLNEVRRWRLGEILEQAAAEVRLSRGGWQLTRAGLEYVESLPQLLLQMQAESVGKAAANDSPPATGKPAPVPPPSRPAAPITAAAAGRPATSAKPAPSPTKPRPTRLPRR